MHASNTPKPPYVPYFILFGAVDGDVLSVAYYECIASGALYLFVIALIIAIIATLLYLLFLKQRTKYHNIAIVCCIGYVTAVAVAYIVLYKMMLVPRLF
jgi:formate-dependent nitrite reductase membrane component NrfD